MYHQNYRSLVSLVIKCILVNYARPKLSNERNLDIQKFFHTCERVFICRSKKRTMKYSYVAPHKYLQEGSQNWLDVKIVSWWYITMSDDSVATWDRILLLIATKRLDNILPYTAVIPPIKSLAFDFTRFGRIVWIRRLQENLRLYYMRMISTVSTFYVLIIRVYMHWGWILVEGSGVNQNRVWPVGYKIIQVNRNTLLTSRTKLEVDKGVNLQKKITVTVAS